MPKAKIDGWVEENEEIKTNIPKKCPKCNTKLSKTDARRYGGPLLIICPNLNCRWAEIFE